MKSGRRFKSEMVMLIEHDETSHYIAETLLKSNGFARHVHIHSDPLTALQCLDMLQKIEGGFKLLPEYIFLDLHFPFEDGFYFLEHFQSLPIEVRHSTRIVILTSSANPEEIKIARNYKHVIGHFQKPLKQKDLANLW